MSGIGNQIASLFSQMLPNTHTGLEFQMDNSMLGVSHEMKAINHDRLNKGLNGDYKTSVLKHIIELVDPICRDMLIIESVDSVGIALTRNMS